MLLTFSLQDILVPESEEMMLVWTSRRMNGYRKQSIVYAVRDYQPLKESSVACSATTTDGARSLTMRHRLIGRC
ncbi:hypothetical protein F2Q68_00008129 [Brassica cretica]|uniref:Uncharacterized protein n=1 Tax=Brassica cretica TaxID=69181 RepID=A0A8S9KY85_BRACR|nr:hypothetical protein F2Q68_00008129 [Brassica cretica]